jgi:thiamine-phosphate pyrophosphorylase
VINHSAIQVRLDLPKVYPITDCRLSGLSHAEQVTRLIEGGASLIQLRDKQATPAEFYRQAAAALKIARDHEVRLIINDCVDIALVLKADGVHLGQTDMPAEAARRLLGPQAIIGFSTHNLEQAKRAAALPVDYLAFGPIFPTSTKENPDPITGLDALREISALKGSIPLVAIGGISFETGIKVLESGADALALIAELVADSSLIAQNTSRMLALTSVAPNTSSPR